MNQSTCSVIDCLNIVGPKGARGLCPTHYSRFRRNGDPLKKAPDATCADCQETFAPRNRLALRCDPCKKVFTVAYNREWRKKNPAYHSDYNKKWREDNPEQYRAYYTQYRLDNLEVIRERFATWEAVNPKHTSDWIKRNPERARETVRRRRSRLREVPNFTVTAKDIQRLLTRFHGCCAYCNERLSPDYHMDHVLPVSLGGSNGIGNLAPACATCNVSKSNWTLAEWRYRDRLSKPLKRRASTHNRVPQSSYVLNP